MDLYGRSFSRREIEARVGRIEQVAGITRSRLVEGPGKGVDVIRVRTGGGLEFDVVPDRALDISFASFGGTPISWTAPNGLVHPAFFEERGLRFLRNASGGLLMTCGLTQVGSPSQVNGEQLGLHGQIHHTPARQVTASGSWSGDEYDLTVGGRTEETSIFGAKLALDRTIRCRAGRNRIDIYDTVENIGFQTAPHMILYHFNFGWPLLQRHSRIHIPARETERRDPEDPFDAWDTWQEPDPDVDERVAYHTGFDGEDGMARATIENEAFAIGGLGQVGVKVNLCWSVETLPRLVQWWMPGAVEHVLGLEPANCLVDGQAAERARGTLVEIEPGKSLKYHLALEIETSS